MCRSKNTKVQTLVHLIPDRTNDLSEIRHLQETAGTLREKMLKAPPIPIAGFISGMNLVRLETAAVFHLTVLSAKFVLKTVCLARIQLAQW
jgi:hypothetical protein